MKALRLTGVGKPLRLQAIPEPRPGDREVVGKVRAAGICRPDAYYRAGSSPAGPLPLTLSALLTKTVLPADGLGPPA